MRMLLRKFGILTCIFASVQETAATFHLNGTITETFSNGVTLVKDVLDVNPSATCVLSIITKEGDHSAQAIAQNIMKSLNECGAGVFELQLNDILSENNTEDSANKDADDARKFRQQNAAEMAVIVVSEEESFLSAFAEASLKNRLLVWSTKLLVLTRLSTDVLRPLLRRHWTFSMMNAMVLNHEAIEGKSRSQWNIYSCLPFSPNGNQVLRIASWIPKEGFLSDFHATFFPDKFSNFHGSTVNITALDYAPYWESVKTKSSDGVMTEAFEGSDAQLLKYIADGLNFNFFNLPTNSWDEVAQFVTDRKSFLSPVAHYVLPQRLNLYDFSFTFEFDDMALTASKPALRPKWQSLYYPLTADVWASILVALIVVPLIFYLMYLIGYMQHTQKEVKSGMIAETVFGMMLSQSRPFHFPESSSSRLAFASWLLFSFIIGTAYRGNLIASLTLPQYPPRPETMEEMVMAVDKIVAPSYGADFRDFFARSKSEVFREAAKNMDIGPDVLDGLQRCITNREAYLDGRLYMRQNIAKHFTRADGSTLLYVGRGSVLPGFGAWPYVFDAPFRPQFDRLLMSALEGGLYGKWGKDTLEDTRLESQRRQREKDEGEGGGEVLADNEAIIKEDGRQSLGALTITHTQGPFMLLGLGLTLASVSLSAEMVMVKLSS